MTSPVLYMAPLRGFTNHIFRNLFAEHFGGFDLAVAPFISTITGHRVTKKLVKDILPENNTGMPVIPQIMGRNPKDFIFLANHLYDMDHETINWNLGCPFPMVAKKKRGSGMLPYTDMIQEFLDEVIPALNGNISIKARLGRKSKEDIFRLLSVLNQYPINEIIIHPRTGIQMYKGEVDLDAFEHCLSLTSHPIIYNGDIRSLNDFKKISGLFADINKWMIGRGALFNPFLPMIIKTGKDDISKKPEKMKKFHDDLYQQYREVLSGPSHILDKMKGYWSFFALSFKDGKKIMKKIQRLKKPDKYLSVVNEFFETEAEWM